MSHIPQYTIQNRNVHISVLNGALWGIEQVHCGICESGQLPPFVIGWPVCSEYRLACLWRDYSYFNTLRPRQNGRHFADDIFKCIFVNKNIWIASKILLKFVPKGPINNIPSLVQLMAWRRTDDNPLSEPSLPTYIRVSRPWWLKDSSPSKWRVTWTNGFSDCSRFASISIYNPAAL